KARAQLNKLIDQYPGTPSASEAKTLLNGLELRGNGLGMPLGAVIATREARAIVEKAAVAHGGREAMRRFGAIQAPTRGLIESQGLEFIRELSFQSPDRLKEVLHVADGQQRFDVIRVYNGKQGWIKSMGRARNMGETLGETVKEEMERMNLPRLLF